jgi:hypothetical protein
LVFLSDKAMIVWLFMLSISIGIAVAQFVYADAYGVVLLDKDGKPLKDIILLLTNTKTQNELLGQTNSLNSTSIQSNPLGVASAISTIAVTLVELVCGVYVFDILWHLGVPLIFVSGMVLLYVALLGRAILGWIRGVF